ncbi:MAG TPA: hypothetical protein VLB79_08910 [Solirubrobacterales bacterium]|nr:hypothetical protein [Solirubrobacterales bacterium]
MRVRRVVGIAAVVATAACASALASGPVATSSAKRPLLISNCAKAKFKPKNVIIACGDASFGARGMTWSAWTKKRALGTGTGEINDCNPDCVHGTTRRAPIELRLTKPQRCSNGQRLFSKLHYTWTAGAPVGPASGSVPMGCKLAGI